MEQVIWKPIRGFEDRYLISNDGRVKSLDVEVKCRGDKTRVHRGKVVPPKANNRGYKQVGLWREGKGTRRLLHRLVTEAFVPNPYDKPQVNHIDGDRNNNCAQNLEWVTDNENKEHSAIAVGGTQRPQKPVLVTCTTTGEKFTYKGLREAERALGLDHGSALKVAQGKYKQTKGYTISFVQGGDSPTLLLACVSDSSY